MRTRWWICAAALVVAALVVAGIVLWPSSGTHPKRPVAAPSPVAAAPSTPRPMATPAPAPVAIQQVAAAAPTRFTMTGPAAHPYSIEAHVCGMAYVRPLDPPGEQHHTVCWVKKDFGMAPGSASATTYILGHAWGQDQLEVMNPASQPATQQILKVAKNGRSTKLDGIRIYPTTVLDGSTIDLKTKTGMLTYTVRQVYGVAKSEAGNVRSLMNEKTPNRIVIITCAESHHVDYDYDVIINAYLSRSRPLPT